jgi:hypothetical protein
MRRSARAPAAREWRRWCSSRTPQNHHPGQLAAHIALGITRGGLVGDRGQTGATGRADCARVLGSPSALRTKEPRAGGQPRGEAGSPRARFVLRKSLDTYLRVLKPACGPPGPVGNILADVGT